jgi:cell division septum initiation protein DivIVA
MEEKKKQEQIKEQIKKLRKELPNQPDLTIKRLPERTEFEFKQLAQKEFCNDYGMALKFLMDFYTGMMPNAENEAILETLANHEQRLVTLETKPKEPEKTVMTVGGKPIIIPNRRNRK